jgi:hypothetical protein
LAGVREEGKKRKIRIMSVARGKKTTALAEWPQI